MNKTKIENFLNEDQIQQCMSIISDMSPCRHVDVITNEIIGPNIYSINEKLGQQNDPKYLAYMVLFAHMQSSKQ